MAGNWQIEAVDDHTARIIHDGEVVATIREKPERRWLNGSNFDEWRTYVVAGREVRESGAPFARMKFTSTIAATGADVEMAKEEV